MNDGICNIWHIRKILKNDYMKIQKNVYIMVVRKKQQIQLFKIVLIEVLLVSMVSISFLTILLDIYIYSFLGTVYGCGVYFSTDATYSHGYAHPNSNGEHCMFVCRVLVGKTTRGNSSMKTRPLGFDSTTDENHMTVTYHDAQAYAEYLITYK